MDKLIKPLLETLDKEPMTPHQLAAKLEKNVGVIELCMSSSANWSRHMGFYSVYSQSS